MGIEPTSDAQKSAENLHSDDPGAQKTPLDFPPAVRGAERRHVPGLTDGHRLDRIATNIRRLVEGGGK